MGNILEVKDLYKNIGKNKIIKGISFEVKDNEIIGFIGPNGSGKSTTLKCISGLYIPTSGEIKIGGHSVLKSREKALSYLGVSIEYPALYPELSGLDHLKMVGRWKGIGKEKIEKMVEYSGLNEKINVKTRKYSMGMKQRLILAISMISEPKLLILDEPTNGLDPQAIFDLRQRLIEIKKNNASILFSSHQLGEVEKIADRVIFIKDGTVLQEISSKEFSKIYKKYKIEISSSEEVADILEEMQGIKLIENVEIEGGKNSIIVVDALSDKDFANMISTLSRKEINIYRVEDLEFNLEDQYKKIYSED